jgi:hypothetical protein
VVGLWKRSVWPIMGNIQGDSGGMVSILAGDICHFEKEVHMNMCLILNGYQDGAQQSTDSATRWVSVARISSGYFFLYYPY